jgi:hypothetical protein
MIQQVRRLLSTLPFHRFRIRAYDDEGLVTIISALHITSVEATEAIA